VLQAKEHALTPYPSLVFTFGFVVEFIIELGGASNIWFLKFFFKSKLQPYLRVVTVGMKRKTL